ncbi:hypothetical protein KIPB_009079, partial [Kipferlia bialata]|eukprot:g9079.t1
MSKTSSIGCRDMWILTAWTALVALVGLAVLMPFDEAISEYFI